MLARSFAFVALALAGALPLPGLYAQERPRPVEIGADCGAGGEIEIVNGALVVKPGEPKQPAPAPVAAVDGQVLEFTDGARMHGQIVKLGAEDITWRRSDIAQPLLFSLRDVRRITLRAPAKAPDLKTNATLQLKGGGWIAGDISSFGNDSFRMKLDASSELTVAREKILWMLLSPAISPDAYDGPGGVMGLAGWNGGGAWESTDAGLVARGTPAPITRKFDFLPDKVDIEITAGDTAQGNGGMATLMLGAGQDTNNYSKGYVQLQLQSANISANAFDGQTNKNFQVPFQPEKGAPKLARYRILHDRRAGKLIVILNGKKLAEWMVPANKSVPPGGSMTFQPNSWGAESSWTIAKVRIRPWDGNTEPDAKPDEAGKDLLSADAAGRHVGKLEGIGDDAVRFGGKEYPRKEPLFIRLAGNDAAGPEDAALSRVRLARRGEFDAAAIEISEGNIKVRTSFAGEITLPLESIGSIDFPHRRAAEDAAAGSRLVFRNGDVLRGSIVSTGPDNAMKWQPARGAVLELGVGGLAGVLLAGGAVSPAPAVSAVARFRNGDWVAGDLAHLDGKQLRFKQPLAGMLQVDRAKVGSLYFSAAGAVPVWDGSADRDTWMRGPAGYGANVPGRQSRWRYLDGTFALQEGGQNQWNDGSNHVLGRNLAGLPEKAEVSFDVTAKSGQVAFLLQLFMDPTRGGGLMIQCNGDQAWIHDNSPQQGFVQRQPVQLQLDKSETPNGPRRFRLLADRKTGQIAMFVNGKLAGQYSPRVGKPSPKRGRNVVFMPQGMPLTVSNIWIAPWVGTIPRMPGKQPAAQPDEAPKPAGPEPPPSDVISLANGDETPGTVEGATPEELRLRCEAGDVEFPLSRALMVEFAGAPVPPVPGIHLRLAGGGLLTVQSFKLADGAVSCRNALLGDLSFPVSALAEIAFHQPGQLPFAGVPPDEKPPVKKPPAPPLERARLDNAGMEGVPARRYDYLQSIDGEDAVMGRFTMKTSVENDSVTLEDELITSKANVTSFIRKTTAERNATLRMKRIVSASSRGGRQTQQNVSVADNKATLHWEGGEPKRDDQVLDYPPNTVTLFSLMRIVTALPRDAGGAWTVERVFSEFQMRIQQPQKYRLECSGRETVERDNRKHTWTHFTLRSDRNDEEVAAEFFLDDMNVLQRAEFAGSFSLRLQADDQ